LKAPLEIVVGNRG